MSVDFFSNFYVPGRSVAGAACILILLFLCASPAYAHKVHIFAYADGDLLKTESRFNGGRPARNCTVNVHALSGDDIVETGKTDDQGLYHFPVPEQGGDLDIITTCGDGHRGSWRIEAREYLSAEAEPASHVHPQPGQASPQSHDNHEVVMRKS